MSNSAKKDMFVMLTLTAIKDGREWNSVTEKYPNQSKASYTEIQKRLSETLIQLGLDGLAMTGTDDKAPPPGVMR